MSYEASIFYQRPDATLVKLPDNLDKALDRVAQELIDGHHGGKLCTLRCPQQPAFVVAPNGTLDRQTFNGAKEWLGAYLAVAKR